MSRRKLVNVLSSHSREAVDPLSWDWPISPKIFRVYDKYTEKDSILELGAEIWILSVQGKRQEFRFRSESDRVLQQKLVMLTQVDRAPSSIYQFTRSLLLNWTLYVRLLEEGPSNVQESWDECVHDIGTAKAAKTILKLVVRSSLGRWRERHQDLVKGLNTRANATIAEQRRKIRQRKSLVTAAQQSELVRVLDLRASEPDLLEWQAAGMATLVFAFQHGMRPVQQLSLKLEHVHSFVDSSGEPICLVSFHTAKQKKAETVTGEMVRQVKPEWVRPVMLLLEYAKNAGRTRLFSTGSGDDLWANVRKICAEVGVKINYSINKLRHSSAQALADAGHSRKSIQLFLGHSNDNAATSYIQASRHQGALINAALGTSKLYDRLVSLAFGEYVTAGELNRLDEAEQIGGIVGEKPYIATALFRGKTE
jgi:integrase